MHNMLREYLGTTYEYDTQGNTVLIRPSVSGISNPEGNLELAYDADNRLTFATRTSANSTQQARYSYDAFGRRIAKRVITQRLNDGAYSPSEANTYTDITTLFVWDGDVMAQEIHASKTVTFLYEPNSFVPLAQIESREGASTYAPNDTHLWSLGEWDLPRYRQEFDCHVELWWSSLKEQAEIHHRQQWEHRLAAAEVDAIRDRILYYHCDHLGTPLELRDDEGEIIWSAQYRAWGRILTRPINNVEQALRFQGQYEDEETGLFYTRHRYYNPDVGRFISQDPIGLLGGSNLYTYAPNPTGWVDPFGLSPRCPWPVTDLEMKSLAIQGELINPQKKHQIPYNSTTTAVGRLRDAEGNHILIATTSAGRFTPAQIARAEAIGVKPISQPNIKGPEGHAERLMIERYARENGYTVEEVAASRPICPTCHECMQRNDVKPGGRIKKVKR